MSCEAAPAAINSSFTSTRAVMPTETIATFNTRGAAELAAAQLKAADIEATLFGGDMSHVSGLFSPDAHGITLRVDAADADEARAILESDAG